MASINMVILAGNLTRDPEMRFTPSGMAVAKIGLAVSRKFKDPKTNEMREDVTFVDIDVFGKQAEVAGQYLSKGRPVLIEGRLQLDQWDDKQTGQKRSKLKVVASRIQFLGSKPEGGGGGGAPRPAAARPQNRSAQPNKAAESGGGDDMPEMDADLDIPQDNIPF